LCKQQKNDKKVLYGGYDFLAPLMIPPICFVNIEVIIREYLAACLTSLAHPYTGEQVVDPLFPNIVLLPQLTHYDACESEPFRLAASPVWPLQQLLA
jgi:hypothetical protein